MTRSQLILTFARSLLRDPQATLWAVANQDELARRDLIAQHGLSQLPTIDLLDLFGDISDELPTYSYLEGTSLVTDLLLLRLLARRHPQPDYLEIGTWRGESLANVAALGARCVSISLSPEEMRSRGMGEEFVRAHGVFLDDAYDIQHIGHDSTTYDFGQLDRRFDLVFVDGDHTRASVGRDTENVFRVLRDDSSVIVWHDYGASTETVRPSVLGGILDGAPADERRHLYHVSNTLCAIYIRGDFPTRMTSFPEMPTKNFRVAVSAQRL